MAMPGCSGTVSFIIAVSTMHILGPSSASPILIEVISLEVNKNRLNHRIYPSSYRSSEDGPYPTDQP